MQQELAAAAARRAAAAVAAAQAKVARLEPSIKPFVVTAITGQPTTELEKAMTNLDTINVNLPKVTKAITTLDESISKLSEAPASYEIKDPDTGVIRGVMGSDIDLLKQQKTELETWAQSAKATIPKLEKQVVALEEYKPGKGVTKWTIHGKTFDTKAEAKAYAKSYAESFVGPPKGAILDPRLDALGELHRAGIVEEKGKGTGIFSLTVSPEGMTSKQIRLANQAGFELEDLPSGPSWNLYQWGKETLEKGSPAQVQVQYWASMLGQFEQSSTSLYRAIVSKIPGEQPGEKGWKKITPKTVEKIEGLTPIESAAYTLGGVGAAGLGSYVQMVPVGVAAAGITTLTSNIALGLKITAPSAIAKISEALATHPKLVQALIFAPVAGIEAHTVYTRYKKGENLDDIVKDVLTDAAEIVGGVAGLKTGYELPSKIKSWWATRGMEEIPIEELMRQYTIDTRSLPTYSTESSKTQLEQYKELAKILGGEEYLGKLSPEQFRSWHGTPEQWTYGIGEETIAGTGKNIKLPGLFLAPEPSPLRLGWGAGTGEAARLGLPIIGKTPGLVSIDSLVAQMPAGLTKAQATKWLFNRIGSGTLYVPNAPFISAEMEAYLPAGSKMVKVGADFYTVFAGQRIPISQYLIVTTAEATALVSAGYTVESVSKVISSMSRMPYVQTVFPVSALPTSMSLGLGDTLSVSAGDITKLELSKLNNIFGTDITIKSFTEYPNKTIGSIFADEISKLGITSPIISVMNILNKDVTDLTDSELSKLNTSLGSSYSHSDLSSLEDVTVEDLIALVTTTSDISEDITVPIPITVELPPEEPPEITKVPEVPEPPYITYKEDEEKPPPPTLKQQVKLKQIKLQLRGFGPKEKYRVKFTYPRGPGETFTVEARSYPEAMNRAQRARRGNRYQPSLVDLMRVT